jgi:hypothetical protein
MAPLLIVHLAATWFMTGLIWVIQLVHYPLFANVGALPADAYLRYQRAHMARISFIVGPVMLLEMITAGLLIARMPEAVSPAILWTNLVMLLLIWLSTACLQGPCHKRLTGGFDARLIEQLVRGNWLRTALWTGRAVLLSVAVVV